MFSKNLLVNIDVSKDNQKFYSVCGSNTIVCKDTDVLILGCNTSIIPSNVKVIANYSFMNCKFIRRRINIPRNISCDYDAFKGSE